MAVKVPCPENGAPEEPSGITGARAMDRPEPSLDSSIEQMLRKLEARMERIEKHFDLPPFPDNALEAEVNERKGARGPPPAVEQGALELQIGKLYLAQVGLGSLILGFGLLVTYFHTNWPPVLSAIA